MASFILLAGAFLDQHILGRAGDCVRHVPGCTGGDAGAVGAFWQIRRISHRHEVPVATSAERAAASPPAHTEILLHVDLPALINLLSRGAHDFAHLDRRTRSAAYSVAESVMFLISPPVMCKRSPQPQSQPMPRVAHKAGRRCR